IIEGLRGHTTGYAVPQFVIDAPGGGGKVPINPGYILYHDNEKIVIRNYEGEIFEYPETGNGNVQFAPQREYHDEYLYSSPLAVIPRRRGIFGCLPKRSRDVSTWLDMTHSAARSSQPLFIISF